EPHWYSTIFPWYVISSVFVSGVALLTLILLWMRRGGRFVEVNAHHLHDLGKYVFAFSFFWGYIWFSQFLLIWYTNIGEEAVYYATRMREGWYPLFLLDVGVNFLLPFAILLPAKTKQNPTVLGGVSLLVLLGHWLDFYLLVMPATMKGAPVFGWIEVAIFLGVGALFLLFCDRGLRRAALLPSKDPLFAESVHHHES
ncbi:MAG: quinol:cytochrome C oxidoreductase, partial [Deltaproteobacteria bacterium]